MTDFTPPGAGNAWVAEFVTEIRRTFTDAAVVACIIVAIYLLEKLLDSLFPPDGPIMFRNTPFEFPFQWMVDTMHGTAFGMFIVRVIRRQFRS